MDCNLVLEQLRTSDDGRITGERVEQVHRAPSRLTVLAPERSRRDSLGLPPGAVRFGIPELCLRTTQSTTPSRAARIPAEAGGSAIPAPRGAGGGPKTAGGSCGGAGCGACAAR